MSTKGNRRAIHQVCTVVNKAVWTNLDVEAIVNMKRRNCCASLSQFAEKFGQNLTTLFFIAWASLVKLPG